MRFAILMLSVWGISLLGEPLLHLPLKNNLKADPDSSLKTVKIHSENISWDKNNDAVFVGNSTIAISGDQLMRRNFTVSLWLAPLPTTRFGVESVFRLPGGNGYHFGGRMYMDRRAGVASLFFGMQSTKPEVMKCGSILDDRFSFLVLVIAGRTVKFYVDGRETATRTMRGEIRYDASRDRVLMLGMCHFPKLNGKIGDFTFWDEPLSPEKIMRLYEVQKERYRKDDASVAAMKKNRETPAVGTSSNLKYYSADKLYVPKGDAAANLLQNPSFESGLNYWKAFVLAYSSQPVHVELIDNAASGSKAVKIRSWRGEWEAGISSFVVKVTPGKKYTVSFQAKADRSAVMQVRIISAVWGQFPLLKNVNLNEKWQRFEFPFTAPDNLAQVSFRSERKPVRDAAICIDAVQLKEGAATAFSELPFCSSLTTAKPGNIFRPQETVAAKLVAVIPRPAPGKIELTGYDFFKVERFRQTLPFHPDVSGRVAIPLDFTGKLKLARGINVVRADFILEDGRRFTDFYRLGIMPSIDRNSRLKHFFSANRIECYPDNVVPFEMFRNFGFGALVNFSRIHELPYAMNYQKYGFLGMTSIFVNGHFSRSWQDERADRRGTAWDVKYDYMKLTDAQIAEIARRAGEKVRACPYIKYWKLVNEPGPLHARDSDVRQFMKVNRQVAEAIRRANPEAKILSPDPTNIYVSDGARTIEKFISEGMLNFVDIISIHPYRPHPDAMDLDRDLANLLDILDRHKFAGEVWISESMNYLNYEIPEIGWEVSDHAATDNSRGQSFSYDLGFGERLSTAYRARSWLIALRYADRIKLCCDWTACNENYFLDAYNVPRALGWVPNTLISLFGQAVFSEEVKISDEIRCYLFRDGNTALAALWNRDREIDMEKRAPTAIRLPFAPDEVSLIDLMGNPNEFKKDERRNVRSCPFFFRSKTLDYAAFAAKIKAIRQEGGRLAKLNVVETILAPDRLRLSLRNMTAGILAGKLRYSVNSIEKINTGLSLEPQQEKTFDLTLPIPQQPLFGLASSATFRMPDGTTFSSNQKYMLLTSPRLRRPITIDGDLSDWPDAGIRLPSRLINYAEKVSPAGHGDRLAARLYSGWDERYFYLAVAVRDAFFQPSADAGKFWQGDSLQLYFDTQNDARAGRNRDFDNNDYSYGVFWRKGQCQVVRDVVPEWQFCFLKTGAALEVKRAFKRTGDGYICELAFPAASILPIKLERNSSFGFSLLINDNNGKGRAAGLPLMPEAIEPFRNADQWPTMILTE